MSTRSDDDVLDLLAKAAAAHRDPPMSADQARAMARHAVVAAAGRRAQAGRRRAVASALGIAAAIALAFGAGRMLAPLDPSPAGPAAEPVVAAPGTIELPTGDRLTTLPTARFAVVAASERERVTRLDEGEVLFDVAAGTARFAVLTPDARVEVRGTVFAVRVDGMRTRVHVFEGRVEVVRSGESTLLEEGEGLDTRSADRWQPALAELGHAARERRARAERDVADEVAPPESAPQLGAPQPGAPQPPRPGAPSLEEARRALTAGDAERVLALAARSGRRGEWAMLEGDALRALRRNQEAADAYDRAARTSSPSPATQAGYLAARLRLERLHEPAGALASLDASRADAPHSPVEDAALALRARALLALDRRDDARVVARRHLARFPASPSSPWMVRLAGDAAQERAPR